MKKTLWIGVLWLLVSLVVSCTPPSSSEPNSEPVSDASVKDSPVIAPKVDYPLDNTLRLNHLQALGTHNSYHVQSEGAIDAWKYTHKPLNQQLGPQGVRQFELDLYWDKDKQHYLVQHIPLLDEGTNCSTFVKCLQVMKDWSVRHPQHLPMFVMIETKLGDKSAPPQLFEKIEKEVLSVFPKDKIIKPDDVQKSYKTIQEAVNKEGWPTLKESRGKIFFMLLTSQKRRDLYTNNGTTLKGKLMFVNGAVDDPLSAVIAIDNPIKEEKKIQEAVKKGLLIRTRSDADLTASKEDLQKRLDAALRSGAHFLSTDFPYPRKDGYKASIPGGTPVRCNPVLAPKECTSKALEQGNDTP